MENVGVNKIAVLAIIISDTDAVERVNSILHEFKDYVISRQGVPYRQRNISLISVFLDAPQTVLNSLSGKLGMIKGVSSKLLNSK
jgi:putative iron-only hydrogenase system regulator